MQVPVSFMTVALFAVIAQALFAAGLLAAAPVNRFSNRFLAVLMVAIALNSGGDIDTRGEKHAVAAPHAEAAASR